MYCPKVMKLKGFFFQIFIYRYISIAQSQAEVKMFSPDVFLKSTAARKKVNFLFY